MKDDSNQHLAVCDPKGLDWGANCGDTVTDGVLDPEEDDEEDYMIEATLDSGKFCSYMLPPPPMEDDMEDDMRRNLKDDKDKPETGILIYADKMDNVEAEVVHFSDMDKKYIVTKLKPMTDDSGRRYLAPVDEFAEDIA